MVHYKTLSRYDKSACTDAALKHNKTYYSTVFAYNNALNSKPTNSTSDGGKYVYIFPNLHEYEYVYYTEALSKINRLNQELFRKLLYYTPSISLFAFRFFSNMKIM